jgi:hypothetical protein
MVSRHRIAITNNLLRQALQATGVRTLDEVVDLGSLQLHRWGGAGFRPSGTGVTVSVVNGSRTRWRTGRRPVAACQQPRAGAQSSKQQQQAGAARHHRRSPRGASDPDLSTTTYALQDCFRPWGHRCSIPMTIPRTAATQAHSSLSPPRLLARLLGRAPRTSAAAVWPSAHGATAAGRGGGNDFTAAVGPFCSNLRLLLLPRAVR